MLAPGIVNRVRRRRPLNLVQQLRVQQDGDRLRIDFSLRPSARATALWSLRSDTETWTRLGDASGSVACDLATIAGPEAPASESATAYLYVEVDESAPAGSEFGAALARRRDVELTTVGDEVHARFRALLGRSAHTASGELAPVGRYTPYLSQAGGVAVAVDRPVLPFGDVYVTSIRGHDGVLRLRGRINTRHGSLVRADLQLLARTTEQEIVRPLTLDVDAERTANRYGQHWYDYRVDADWALLWRDGPAANDVFDAWAVLHIEGAREPLRVRIGKTRLPVRMLTRPFWVTHGAASAAITPYYTFKAKRTSFQVDLFDTDTATYLRQQVRRRHVERLRHRSSRGKPVWLVGERPYKAQDTGLAMFRWLRQNRPDIDAYYVIDRHSPERANVAPYGNVVDHRSKEHVRLSLLAERVLASHHPDFTFPLRTARYRRAVRARTVFLQHGVMGTKWMVPNYGRGAGDFETDVFIASSEHEKRYLVGDFGWRPEQVAVTGLTRFDTLFADDVPLRRQLVIMPTWRDWLQDAETYLASDYHVTWSALLHDPRLAEMASRYSFEIVFCLHPNMQQFTRLFADAPVQVISQGELDVQHLLKQSAFLLTDFSSVGFDFAFLDKPVVYYQFDRARFLGPPGSHLDLDRELPGTVVRRHDAVLEALEHIAKDDFAMQPGMRERADRFIDHRDRLNCERVFDATVAARRARPSIGDVLARPLPAAAIRRWRRSGVYFPMMRLMFRVLQRLPADENLVLFESGVGRQYADSPRYIYEELVRRGSPLKKVWAYSRKIHTSDEHTAVVERLSPGYFWHLARAKYWVNNQNFPHYITRRPDGVYVQTWHGTPLKRMLLDVEEHAGRDDGYVARMLRASAQWSVLVSPSPFASTTISRAYGYSGATLEVGYPRNDVLRSPARDEVGEEVRVWLGIPPGSRVVMYAPTFRDDQTSGGGKFGFELPFDLHAVVERLGPDTVLLLRMHVVVAKSVAIPAELEGRVLDVARYPEIQQLYLASDALITDYSSVFFDYAELRRPILFYAYDLDNYRDNLRGFYLDYLTDVPGPILTTEDELLTALGDLDAVRAAYVDRMDAFLARFAPMDDGHAAERVVDAVFGT